MIFEWILTMRDNLLEKQKISFFCTKFYKK